MKEILNNTALGSHIKDLAASLVKQYPNLDEVVFIGIQQGGVVVGNEIVAEIQNISH